MPNYKIGIDLDADDNASGDIKKVSSAADSLDKSFAKSSGGASGLGASLAGLVNPAGLALGAVTAIGGAAIAVAGHAMDLASQVEIATNSMQTQLGATEEEAAGLETVMRNIYEANYGQGFEDIGASLATVEQTMERIGGAGTPEALEDITIKALSMRDAFGFEVSDSIGAVTTLMENFGLTSTQAFDFLVAGQQRGLNASGDLLDSIGEYSVQLSQGGATAEEFFSILESGMQGGMLGTDKAADSFKEFQIRITDDSTLTKDALAGIGISYDTLKKGFADGSITQIQAMQMVIEKINEIEDPVQRNIAGVALFGTQWEDLTDQVITNIDTQKTKLEELEGASASLEEQYDNSAAAWENATRKWDNALVDVGKEFNSLQTVLLPGLAGAVDIFIVPAIGKFTDFLSKTIELTASLVDWMSKLDPNLLWLIFGGKPPWQAEGSAVGASAGLSVQGSSLGLPVMTPQPMAVTPTGSASWQMGNENHVNVYVERGDPDVVRDAAEIGVRRAQRSRGE